MERLGSAVEKAMFMLALVACGAPQKQEPTLPTALEQGCADARNAVVAALNSGSKTGDEDLQQAIDGMKNACGISQEKSGDVVHLLIEDLAQGARRTPTCAEMMDNFAVVPQICGVPMVQVLLDQCGEGEVISRLPDEVATQWTSPKFSANEIGAERLYASCRRSNLINHPELPMHVLDIERWRVAVWSSEVMSGMISGQQPLMMEQFRIFYGPQAIAMGQKTEYPGEGSYRSGTRSIECGITQYAALFRNNRLCPKTGTEK